MTRTHVTCLDCGTEFVRPNGYAGNYCLSCHESWTADEDSRSSSTEESKPRRLRSGTTSSVRPADDDASDAPSRYEEE
ncbi:DUF4685 domain-containing protein [Halobellus litoreus]|jgi:hypothetical protein|uniref:DUF4685 domain-containing protein n=1 Tax=Halobellus litoreus TaxID=755310 RepID=A0ABD6DW25_9EURY|nr:DUF4685 domain-containing protein [Halobellus litoreus]